MKRNIKNNVEVNKAVILAAGHGTRMLPISKIIPKEMLLLGKKPILEYIVEEICSSGISEILMVISPGKDMIRDYFGDGSEWGVKCKYLIQSEMKGPADAVLLSETWTSEQPFLIALGDCVIIGAENDTNTFVHPTKRLVETFLSQQPTVSLLAEYVPVEREIDAGVILSSIDETNIQYVPHQITIMNKLAKNSVSRTSLIAAARWISCSKIFSYLRNTTPDGDGQIRLPTALSNMIENEESVWVVPLVNGEARYDLGTWHSYLNRLSRICSQLIDGYENVSQTTIHD